MSERVAASSTAVNSKSSCSGVSSSTPRSCSAAHDFGLTSRWASSTRAYSSGLSAMALRLRDEARHARVDPRLHQRQCLRVEVVAAAVLVVLDVEPGAGQPLAGVAGELDGDHGIARAVGDEHRLAGARVEL